MISREIDNYPVCFWKNAMYTGIKLDNIMIWSHYDLRKNIADLYAEYHLVTDNDKQKEIFNKTVKFLTEAEKKRVEDMLNGNETYFVSKAEILSAREKYPTQQQVLAKLFPQVVNITTLDKVKPGQKFHFINSQNVFIMMKYHEHFIGLSHFNGDILKYVYTDNKYNKLYAENNGNREVILVD